MPGFRTWPDAEPRDTRLPLLRVKPEKDVHGVCLSSKPEGADTHYWRGRTTMCTHPECEPCEKGHVYRWYGYVALLGFKSNTIAMVEITPAVTAEMQAWIATHGTLRASEWHLRRKNRKPNSELLLTITESGRASVALPPEPDLLRPLCKMWDLDYDQIVKFRTPKADYAKILKHARDA